MKIKNYFFEDEEEEEEEEDEESVSSDESSESADKSPSFLAFFVKIFSFSSSSLRFFLSASAFRFSIAFKPVSFINETMTETFNVKRYEIPGFIFSVNLTARISVGLNLVADWAKPRLDRPFKAFPLKVRVCFSNERSENWLVVTGAIGFAYKYNVRVTWPFTGWRIRKGSAPSSVPSCLSFILSTPSVPFSVTDFKENSCDEFNPPEITRSVKSSAGTGKLITPRYADACPIPAVAAGQRLIECLSPQTGQGGI